MHGLHHVAQKFSNIGLPSFVMVAEFTFSPFIFLIEAAGMTCFTLSCANAFMHMIKERKPINIRELRDFI
jgi:hypothetical protein